MNSYYSFDRIVELFDSRIILDFILRYDGGITLKLWHDSGITFKLWHDSGITWKLWHDSGFTLKLWH